MPVFGKKKVKKLVKKSMKFEKGFFIKEAEDLVEEIKPEKEQKSKEIQQDHSSKTGQEE